MNVRKIALEAIEKIISQRAYSNIVVNDFLKKFEMPKEDRGLFTNIVYGTLQHYLTIEYYLDPFIGSKKQKSWVKHLLFLSVYQLIYLSIPDYAVLNEAVEIANMKDRFVGKFVNAVLRNFLRHERRSFEGLDDIERLSIQYSHPAWLVAFFLKDYDFQTVEKILIENSQIKKDFIRVNTLKSSNTEVEVILKELKIAYAKQALAANAYQVDEAIVREDLFIQGMITIQDLAAQWVSEVAGPKAGEVVVDLCAAPGGKAAHMAALMNNKGKIYACDLYNHKMKLMKELFNRLNVTNVEMILTDARDILQHLDENSADVVLADVPCSGLGVLGHKVDLKYHMDLASIEEILRLQEELLVSSSKLVKVQGYFIYSTCTINKDENEKQIQQFIQKHPMFEKVMEKTILPFEYHSDGFYVCKMRRNAL